MYLRAVAKYCHDMAWYTGGIAGGAIGTTQNLQFAWLFVIAIILWVLEAVASAFADQIEAGK